MGGGGLALRVSECVPQQLGQFCVDSKMDKWSGDSRMERLPKERDVGRAGPEAHLEEG